MGLIEPNKIIHQNSGFIGETETGLGKKSYITINILLVSDNLDEGLETGEKNEY